MSSLAFLASKRFRHRAYLFLLALPFLAIVVVFSYVPLFGWAYAFFDFVPGVSLSESAFAGLKYFKRVFSGASDFWAVMRNTLGISSLNILFSFVPVLFAIMVSQLHFRKLSRPIQTLASIPNFISWVLVYSIVFMLVASNDSALNIVMTKTGLFDEPYNVLMDVDKAWLVQVFIGIWKNTGFNAIIYLAAIVGIDQELYQAAEVDGAGTMRKIWHVTLPGVVPTYFVLLLLSISNMLSNGFEQFWLFGNGMTWDRLEVFDTYVYRLGIQNMEYSFSTALGIFKSVVSIILLTAANIGSKRIRGTSIF